MKKDPHFSTYKSEGHKWITLAESEYYPDILIQAQELYSPVLIKFKELVAKAKTSGELFLEISKTDDQWTRIQLCRVFRKYVSPATPVEMLKQKRKAGEIVEKFGKQFRDISEVKKFALDRADDDEVISTILWEYKDRGQSGYNLTEKAFEIIRTLFPDFVVTGPERAGRDILLGEILEDYPKPDRPVDLVIKNSDGELLAVGLARYDGDRGGAQEDDRTGQYREVADELIGFYEKKLMSVAKVIFINDGPGLLLGSMWDDYSYIESKNPSRIKVITLKMLNTRLTREWLESE